MKPFLLLVQKKRFQTSKEKDPRGFRSPLTPKRPRGGTAAAVPPSGKPLPESDEVQACFARIGDCSLHIAGVIALQQWF